MYWDPKGPMHGVKDIEKKTNDGSHIALGASLCPNSVCRMMFFLGHFRDRRRLGKNINRLGITF